MFVQEITKYPCFDQACRDFALRHNVSDIAIKSRINAQMLRNKLNPDQKHQLTCADLLRITQESADNSLLDAMLIEMRCMPSLPVDELPAEKLDTYALKATAEVGNIAAFAVSGEKMTPRRRSALMANINASVRYLSLAALAIQARIQVNPALATTFDVVSDLGSSILPG